MAAIVLVRDPIIHVHGRALNEEGVRDLLIDPISLQELENPVIDPCGHTFSRLSIEQWLQHYQVCPLSRQNLRLTDLRVNRVVADLLAILNQDEDAGLALPDRIAALDEHEIAPVEAGLAVIQYRRETDAALPEPIPDRLAVTDPERSVVAEAIALTSSAIRRTLQSFS